MGLTNTQELEIAIKRSNLSKAEVARRLGLSDMGLYKKINNISEFKASEIKLLSEILEIDKENREEIFFKEISDLKSTN